MLPEVHKLVEQDWGTMWDVIRKQWMNCFWLERQKARARQSHYRDSSAPKELPSEYFIHKLELLEFIYQYTEEELITQIMATMPYMWNTVVNLHAFHFLVDLQDTIQFYDHILVQFKWDGASDTGILKNHVAATTTRVATSTNQEAESCM